MNTLLLKNEFEVLRFGAGVQLKPIHAEEKVKKGCYYEPNHSLTSLLQLPVNVYFVTSKSEILICNDSAIQAIGIPLNEVVGKDPFFFQPKEHAQQLIANDRDVTQHKFLKITEEPSLTPEGTTVNFLSFKMPLYEQNRKLMGVFGFSILLEKNPIANGLIQILQTGLLSFDIKNLLTSNTITYQPFKDIFLSPREKLILRHLVRGDTSKLIARKIGTSHRTIENQLVSIKRKLNVKSKAELIDRVIDYF